MEGTAVIPAYLPEVRKKGLERVSWGREAPEAKKTAQNLQFFRFSSGSGHHRIHCAKALTWHRHSCRPLFRFAKVLQTIGPDGRNMAGTVLLGTKALPT